jgi:hypothetical protein
MINFNKYKNITDKYESLFTMLVYDVKLQDIFDYIEYKLKKISYIHNTYKKKYLNDRLYKFKMNLVEMYKKDDKMNYIFLISDDIIKINLKDDIRILREYNINKIIFFNGEYFKINYLVDILYNNNYRHVFELNNKKLNYKKITKYKMKIVDKIDLNNISINDYIKQQNISDKILMHGISTILKNFKCKKNIIYNKKLNNEEINNIFEELEIKEKQDELKEKLIFLNREETINRIKFANEIEECINHSQLEYLYCSPKKMKKVLNNFSEDLLNFKIIEIKSINNNDIGMELKKKYNGIIGVTYY